MFQARLMFGLLLLLGVSSQNEKDSDEGRPYEFSFTIEGEQHRHEKKDVNGIIEGEFGFITGDGVYHVTVYATDENGSFKILSMRNVKISEPLDQGGKRIADVPLPQKSGPVAPAPPATQAPPPPVKAQPAPGPTTPRSITYDFTTATTHRQGCSGCGIVPTPPTGPLKFQNPTFKSQDNGGGQQSSPPRGDVPTGLIARPIAPSGEHSFETPSSTIGPDSVQPQKELLPPGISPAPPSNDGPAGVNPFGPGQPVPQVQNQIPGSPKSALSQVKVEKGMIQVPGNDPIPIKDKYPNMVDGLPDGITEKDITDLLYKFNYTVGFHGHYEKGLKNGAKIGGYFVNGRDGISRVVTYIADENGYRPKFSLINLGLESEDTPKPDSEKKFGLKNFEFIWYPIK